MDHKVLVAYATKYGATQEIAEKIAAAMQDAEIDVHVMDVKQVRDASSYTAVVLGSAVYVGAWRKEAAEFLQNNEEVLSTLPVWLFSSGPTGEGEPVDLMDGWRFPEKLQPIADRINPRAIIVFHGAMDKDKLKIHEKMMIKMVKAPIGDFRVWDAVASWGTKIAAQLKAG